MEKWVDFIVVFGGLYLIYFFTLRRWDYTSQAKQKAEREVLKKQGLSNSFYFIGEWKLFAYIFITGGLYVFYWLYKQWRAVLKGYISTDKKPLKGGPFLRALGGLGTFYQLASIINRTCTYMHKKPAAAAWLSGSFWLASLGAIAALPGTIYKILALVVFAAIPSRLQHRLNALPGQAIPNTFQLADSVPLVLTLLAGIWLWTALLLKISL